MPLPTPQILDVTIRDGSFLINHQYTTEKVAEITKRLSAAGIQYAEISHGVGIGGKSMGYPAVVDDEELMEAAKKAAPELKISAFISPYDVSLPIIPGLIEYFEIGRVGVNVHEVPSAKKVIQKLKKYNKTVSVQLVRTHGRSPEFAGEAAHIAEDLGADIIYVVDSFGSMLPSEVNEYVSAIKANTKSLIGFHGHNNFGLAIPNTLEAWETGATWLDASLMGVGRGAGNARLETLIYLLQEKKIYRELELKTLFAATHEIILPLFSNPPASQYIDLLFAQERLDYPQAEFLSVCAHILGISLEDLLLRLHAKLHEGVALGETHLRAVFKDAGFNYDAMIEKLRGDEIHD